ncbi:MAG: hypothetical protein AB7V26_15455, partial [Lysobacterales bacterium]
MHSTTLASVPAYRDRKRAAWLLSLAVPVLAGAGPLLYLWRDQIALLWLPALLVYVVIPMLDALVGEDPSNPPESALAALEA